MRRAGWLIVLLTVVAGCTTVGWSEREPAGTGSRTLQPLTLGWEQHLAVTWEAGQDHGRPVVSGYVQNTSPYDLAQVRVLVEGLDAAGQVVEQRLGVLPGELRGGGHLYFEVRVAPAATYRVRVFSYDRLESAGLVS